MSRKATPIEVITISVRLYVTMDTLIDTLLAANMERRHSDRTARRDSEVDVARSEYIDALREENRRNRKEKAGKSTHRQQKARGRGVGGG